MYADFVLSRSATDAGMTRKYAGGEEFMYAAAWRVCYLGKSGMALTVLESSDRRPSRDLEVAASAHTLPGGHDPCGMPGAS